MKPKVGIIHRVAASAILHHGYFFDIPDFEVTAVAYQSLFDGVGLNEQFIRRHPKIYFHEDSSLPKVVRTTSFEDSVCRIINENDVIMVWGFKEGLPDFLERCGKPVIVSSQGIGRWTQDVLRYCVPFGTHFTACSKLARHPFPPSVDREKIRVIPNSIYMERIVGNVDPKVFKKQLGLEGKTIIGNIGRMPPNKNAAALLECTHLLPKDYVIVFVGGDINPQLKEEMLDNPKVRYYPETRQVGNMFSILDCFVSPSLCEGDGCAMKEAMLRRIPLVSTFTGTIPELEIEHGQVCTHISFDVTPEEMIEAIEHSLTRPYVDHAEAVTKAVHLSDVLEKKWTELITDCYQGKR